MKHIPPEIDSLLWAVAEDESPRAGDEFVQRYPRYAGELARRRQMVQGLKGVRPHGASAPSSRPAFRPVPETRPPVPRRVALAVGALVLAAVAVGSYTVATMTAPRRREPAPAPIVRVDPPVARQPEIREAAPPVTPPTGTQDVPPVDDSRIDDLSSAQEPRSFKVRNTDLASALTLLGAEAGVKVIVAPGMQKRLITADYTGLTVAEMLEDLGGKYGFTPFDQGDGTIIVVPAEDTTKPEASRDRVTRAPNAARSDVSQP